MLREIKIIDAYSIEGLDTCDDLAEQQGESIENLISTSLIDGNSKYTIWIGSNLDQVTKNQLVGVSNL